MKKAIAIIVLIITSFFWWGWHRYKVWRFDTVIENKIRANTAPKRLSIVSSDRRLRDAARTRKATALKSDVFWDNLQKQLRRKKPVKEPEAKRMGLSESETKQWLEFFGIEQ